MRLLDRFRRKKTSKYAQSFIDRLNRVAMEIKETGVVPSPLEIATKLGVTSRVSHEEMKFSEKAEVIEDWLRKDSKLRAFVLEEISEMQSLSDTDDGGYRVVATNTEMRPQISSAESRSDVGIRNYDPENDPTPPRVSANFHDMSSYERSEVERSSLARDLAGWIIHELRNSLTEGPTSDTRERIVEVLERELPLEADKIRSQRVEIVNLRRKISRIEADASRDREKKMELARRNANFYERIAKLGARQSYFEHTLKHKDAVIEDLKAQLRGYRFHEPHPQHLLFACEEDKEDRSSESDLQSERCPMWKAREWTLRMCPGCGALLGRYNCEACGDFGSRGEYSGPEAVTVTVVERDGHAAQVRAEVAREIAEALQADSTLLIQVAMALAKVQGLPEAIVHHDEFRGPIFSRQAHAATKRAAEFVRERFSTEKEE